MWVGLIHLAEDPKRTKKADAPLNKGGFFLLHDF